MQNKKKKRGRPNGSENKVYQDVVEVPPACHSCGSTNLRIINGNKPLIRNLPGKLRSGITYNRVRWDRKICKDCGQMVGVRKFYTEKSNTKNIIPSENV